MRKFDIKEAFIAGILIFLTSISLSALGVRELFSSLPVGVTDALMGGISALIAVTIILFARRS